uniref:Uncharacterized protein n=1 Tax=Takifugu rubripes TaxID=31033 RepID=A0A3B5KCB7_TAKRU
FSGLVVPTSGGGKSCPNSTGRVWLVHAVVLCFYDPSSLFKGAVPHVEEPALIGSEYPSKRPY